MQKTTEDKFKDNKYYVYFDAQKFRTEALILMCERLEKKPMTYEEIHKFLEEKLTDWKKYAVIKQVSHLIRIGKARFNLIGEQSFYYIKTEEK